MPKPKLLLVDDNETVRISLQKVMEMHDFDVAVAADVADALKQITSTKFDVLISDLHMPGAADGLTVISAMRHANPEAITFLLSANPDLNSAAKAILMQPDEILIKPMDVSALLSVIKHRLAQGATATRLIESVATILERSIDTTVETWLERVANEPKLFIIEMSRELRIAYVPRILADLIVRLRSLHPLGSVELESLAAFEHGLLRRRQGYSAAMMVRESRLLQVSIFQTLQNNLASLDFSVLLNQVMAIADEVASQLSQSIESYSAEAIVDDLSS